MSIKKNTYHNALIAADSLREGVCLTAPADSVLGELLDASVSVLTVKTTSLPSILANPGVRGGDVALTLSDEDRACSVECTTSDYDEASRHTLLIQSVAEDLAPIITSHLSYARNTVAPIVVELANKLEKFAEYAKPIDPVSNFNIILGEIPEPLLDESFMADGLEAYVGVDASYKSIDFSFANPSNEELNAVINVGSDRLNGLVQTWLAKKPENWLRNIYVANFGERSIAGVDISSFILGNVRNVYRRLDISLAVYLIAKRLFAEPQSVEGISLARYKNELRDLIDFAGSEIMKSLRLLKNQLESNTMVTEAVLSRKEITVHKPNYLAWLESGGKPEILLGMLAIGDVRFSVTAIEENRDKFIRGWQSYLALTQVDVKKEMMHRFREYAVNEVMAGLAEMTDLEKEYHQNIDGAQVKVHAKVMEQVERMSHRLMDDIQHTALHLVAKGRFYFTSAYDILNEMNEVAKINPEIDPREAALLSTIAYVSDYLDSMISIEK